jgi:CrcB protein
MFPRADFPYGTLYVNLLGCGAIGVLGALADVRNVLSPEARAFLLIGVLGGFTTFSSFAYETLALARDGESLKATANALLHVTGCLVAAWVGDSIIRVLGSMAR